MDTEDQIVNKVSNYSLITFDLEEYYQPGERVLVDITGQLYEGIILKEKDFRAFIKTHDWSAYQNKFVAITCSTDAIIPTWAYMLISIALKPFAKDVVFGTIADLEIEIFRKALQKVDWSIYTNAKVVLKGCSKIEVPASIYVDATNQLMNYVSSLMFGEPCSTVPLYKKQKFK
ncbi:MAG TPA: DUF2480 family protein [Chryseolinea sp.]|nr:DUF2480 family protein [Chryseolinea sp.]